MRMLKNHLEGFRSDQRGEKWKRDKMIFEIRNKNPKAVILLLNYNDLFIGCLSNCCYRMVQNSVTAVHYWLHPIDKTYWGLRMGRSEINISKNRNDKIRWCKRKVIYEIDRHRWWFELKDECWSEIVVMSWEKLRNLTIKYEVTNDQYNIFYFLLYCTIL